MAVRNYTYYDFTTSVCSSCLNKVDAKIIFQNDNVYIVCYATFRLFEEFLRADTGIEILYGLKFVQFNLLCVIIYFSYWLYLNEFKSRKKNVWIN